MNKKGFTLIELLAVIILLSLLIFIVFPSIANSVKNYSDKTDNLTLTMIESAADLYIEDNSNAFPQKRENSYCVPISELIENDYLKDSVEYDGEDITYTKSVQIIYDGEFNYELVDNASCVDYKEICVAVSEEDKTIGNVPLGNFDAGDEYMCEVRFGTSYRFFVLSSDEVMVNLILDKNILNDGTFATSDTKGFVEWINQSDYEKVGGSNWDLATDKNMFGPITALNYLYSATKKWTNIPNITMDYVDTNAEDAYGYGGIKTLNDKTVVTKKDGTSVAEYKNLKARLPYKSEVNSSTKLWLYTNLTENSSVIEAGGQSISGVHGYWTISSNPASPINVAGLYFDGRLLYNEVDRANRYGIRPVISIPKKYIKNN